MPSVAGRCPGPNRSEGLSNSEPVTAIAFFHELQPEEASWQRKRTFLSRSRQAKANPC